MFLFDIHVIIYFVFKKDLVLFLFLGNMPPEEMCMEVEHQNNIPTSSEENSFAQEGENQVKM